MTDPTTHTLDVDGATLAYDVREAGGSGAPTLVLIGSPMGASGLAPLADRFTDRRVVTYDPRGVERSPRTDGAEQSTPSEHADDVHRVIAAVSDGEPVDLFATSGGAVNALVLVARHPDDVRILVAHEPPALTALPDKEVALEAARRVRETYLRDGFGAGMAAFIALVGHRGELPADYPERPGPDPAMFGLPTSDDGRRDDPLLGANMVTCTHQEHDVEALRAASTRVVLAAGADSAGEVANRCAHAVGDLLGADVVTVPGGHVGFSDGRHGPPGDPDGFAARLREVLEA